LVTLLLIENDIPIAYGHLEPENNTTWLGICVLPEFSRKGYACKMMTALIDKAKKLNINSIYLTVDKNNERAINLYHKFHFCRLDSNENRYKYYLHFVPVK
jgi:ribosomal protein S18 acetylase RimI-like enzyme